MSVCMCINFKFKTKVSQDEYFFRAVAPSGFAGCVVFKFEQLVAPSILIISVHNSCGRTTILRFQETVRSCGYLMPWHLYPGIDSESRCRMFRFRKAIFYKTKCTMRDSPLSHIQSTAGHWSSVLGLWPLVCVPWEQRRNNARATP